MKSFDYDKISHFYDDLEVDDEINRCMVESLHDLFSKHGIVKVWDAACGTGAQSVSLTELGYEVIASDIGDNMLEKARSKKCSGKISFSKGDIRYFQPNTVDAVISMTNVLGHFQESSLKEALDNVSSSLVQGGLYIADFDNRSFLEFPGRVPDGYFVSGKGEFRGSIVQRLSKATVRGDGLYHMHDRWVSKHETIHEAEWDLQSWYREEIESLLESCGF